MFRKVGENQNACEPEAEMLGFLQWGLKGWTRPYATRRENTWNVTKWALMLLTCMFRRHQYGSIKRNLYYPILLGFLANHRRHGNMLTTLLTKKPVVRQDQLYSAETSLDGTSWPNSTRWAPSFTRSTPSSWTRHELTLDPITKLSFPMRQLGSINRI